jgi:hypothetical protein
LLLPGFLFSEEAQVKLFTDKQGNFRPTKPLVVESVGLPGKFEVVFEIDDATAYFYAVSLDGESAGILDACQIYNTKQIEDSAVSSVLEIKWSQDKRYAALFINGYAHAIFDFKDKQGYCRSGFPLMKNPSGWSTVTKNWNAKLFEQFDTM